MSDKLDIKQLLEAGAHFGHRTSRWHPKMGEFIHSKRGGIHIIDLVQTAERLQAACQFAESVAASGKQVLFVGTKAHIAPAVAEAAGAVDMPHITKRWFGGILTNFDTIHSRVQYYKKLTADLDSGELAETYNKRELLGFEEERDKLAYSFAGIVNMDKLPGAVFVTDVAGEKTAVAEANRLNIPLIGIVDSNADPTRIDYPIPANDDALKAVTLIAEQMAAAIKAGQESYAKKPANTTQTKQPPKAKPATKAADKAAATKKSTDKTAAATASKESKQDQPEAAADDKQEEQE